MLKPRTLASRVDLRNAALVVLLAMVAVVLYQNHKIEQALDRPAVGMGTTITIRAASGVVAVERLHGESEADWMTRAMRAVELAGGKSE